MTDQQKLEQAIQTLEAQRGAVDSAALELGIAALRRQLADLSRRPAPEPALRGERKHITVMFADISGFTAMSEKMDPEDVRRLINACFERLSTVIDQYGGYIDKFIGDEIMALFGAPVAHENDPERALRAALDMMVALEQFNVEFADSLPQPLALHFGLNSGLVITGGIGAARRQDYSVLGDTVNLAARLEDLSRAGEILVGAETHRRTAPLLDFEALEPVSLKGKARPVQVYRLLRAKAVHGGQIRGIEGLYAPLVGREDELGRLTQVLEKFYQGEGGVVSVSGVAGLGKSRLVYELRHLAEQQPRGRRAYWAKGHALSYAENAGYLLARDMMRHILGLNLNASPTEAEQALRAQIDQLLPDNAAETYPYLAQLLNLPLDDDAAQRIKYLQGAALQQRIGQAAQSFIRAKSRETPLVLIWEDLHWADPSSLNLLENLLTLTRDCTLLIILVYRPVHEGPLPAFQEHLLAQKYPILQLPPLSAEESGQMLNHLLGDCPLPDKIYNLIVEKTEGNPFFLEEVVRSLIESNVIAYSEDEPGCLVTRPGLEDIQIPNTLQGVIMARIDRLPPQTKRLLQIAAVIGRDFSYRVIARLVDDSAEDLKQLEALDLIKVTQRAPHLEYRFQHIFTRESVYNSLLHSDCRQLHRHIGEILEDLYPQEQIEGDLPLMLAHHFDQGGDKERAIKYLSLAARQAGAVYANQEARALYERALSMVAESEVDAPRWDMLAGLETILNRLGERRQQAITLTIMQTLSTLLDDEARLATTHNRRSHYFDRISEYHAAVEAAESGLRAARRSGNRHLEAESLNLLALAAWRRFDYPEVQRWATQALRALLVVGDPHIRTTSLFHLGRASYRLGQYDLALEYTQAAQELTQEIDNRDGQATSHLILGWIYQRLGHYDQAEQEFKAKLQIRRDIGHRYGEAAALSHLGWLAYDQQQPESGLDYCRRALDISRAIDDRENEAYALSGLALNYEQLGQLDDAAANYDAALAIQREIGAATLAIFSQTGLARIALARQDRNAARETIKPVTEWILAGNAQKFWDPWSIYLSTGKILQALGEQETAHSILDEAHTLLQKRANEISNAELRRCFLERGRVNREIARAWQAVA